MAVAMSVRLMAERVGITPRDGESDAELCARLTAATTYTPTALDVIDYAVTERMLDVAPVGMTIHRGRAALARRWLRHERPRGILARIRWVWRLVREIWR